MTAIFISHSSADNEAAMEMKTWLEEQGHTSLFLDIDPEDGLYGSGDWEQTLYQKLRQCQAVIALLTPDWLASKWCFAELVQTRESGKAIFPVKMKSCDTGGVFRDIQQIDLTFNLDEGYRRLAISLKKRGLDPRDVFNWDPARPLYPGLAAFKEEDAAIFFGRGEEILHGLETMDALRRRGRSAPRLALFLGASGSGKSSLVRAGLIPRLKKTPSEWLPVAPFRPQDDPLDELALALADTFEALEEPRDWIEIRQTLNAAAEQEPADGKVLLTLARELSIAAKQREATVVLTVDQAEELYGYSAPDAATRFLRLLRAALEASDRQLMAVATLRSDSLGEFQTHPALHDSAYDHDFLYQAVPVDPLPERNFVEIIQGPARLAGLKLEEGLVEAMVRDTGTRDALPLLAFTLRQLYERHGKDGLLEIREYDELGRLESAIRGEAERILREADPPPQDLEALRTAFVPAMVRINADGNYARRQAYVEDMPPRAKKLLERFVDSHLLVSDRDKDNCETLEVAHEALLRTWSQLTIWLAEDQDKLRLLDGLHRAAEDWDNSGQPAVLLVHRDGRLEDAEALIANRRFAVQENSLEKRYLDACIETQNARVVAEREEQERRVRDAERIAKEQKKTAHRTRVGLAAAVLLALTSFIAAFVAVDNQREAERLSYQALARQLGAQAEIEMSRPGASPELGALLAAESIKRYQTLDGELAARQALSLYSGELSQVPFTLEGFNHSYRTFAVFDPDRRYMAIAGREGGVSIIDTESGMEASRLLSGTRPTGIAFSIDGHLLAVGLRDTVLVFENWISASPKRLALLDVGRTQGMMLAFTPDDRYLAVVTHEVQIWEIESEELAAPPERFVRQSTSDPATAGAQFSPDGNYLAVTKGPLGRARIIGELALFRGWEQGELSREVLSTGIHLGGSLAVGPDSKFLAVRGTRMRRSTDVWRVAAAVVVNTLSGDFLAMSPDGRYIATEDQSVHVHADWRTSTDQELGRLLLPSGAHSIVFTADGHELVFAVQGQNRDKGVIKRWTSTGSEEVFRVDDISNAEIRLSADGRFVKSFNRVWRIPSGEPVAHVVERGEILDFSPDSALLAVRQDNNIDIWRNWNSASAELIYSLTPGNGGNPKRAVFSPDGHYLTTMTSDPDGAQLWGIETRQEEASAEGFADFSYSGWNGHLAVKNKSDLQIWAQSGERPLWSKNFPNWWFALSPSGPVLAAANRERIDVFDYLADRQLTTFFHDGTFVDVLAFSIDGAYLATAGRDDNRTAGPTQPSASVTQPVLIWDIAGDRLVARLDHPARVTSVAFGGRGKYLGTVTEDGTVRVWLLKPDDLAAEICSRLSRTLTAEEWRRYIDDEPGEQACDQLRVADRDLEN